MSNLLLIRADATSKIGTGHVLRCLALAQAWRTNGGKVFFLSNWEIKNMYQRIVDSGFETLSIDTHCSNDTDLSQTIKYIEKLKPDWCVLDGYHFDSTFQKAVKKCGIKLLVIDDFNNCSKYHADIILNQNLNANVHNYISKEKTIKLLGPKYVMLREEFYTTIDDRTYALIYTKPHRKKVLITFGGSDPHNLTEIALRSLADLQSTGIEATILIGAGNDRENEYKKIINNISLPIKLIFNASNITEFLRAADIVLICGGGTLWECLYFGCPVISLSLNTLQHDILIKLHENNTLIYIGSVDKIKYFQLSKAIRELMRSEYRRNELRQNSIKLIDGRGAIRVIKQMK